MLTRLAARALIKISEKADAQGDHLNSDLTFALARALSAEPGHISSTRFASLYDGEKRVLENGGLRAGGVEPDPEAGPDEVYPGVPRDPDKMRERALNDPNIPTDDYGRPLEGWKPRSGGFISREDLLWEIERMKRELRELRSTESLGNAVTHQTAFAPTSA